ncbi:hypothetical protein NC652_024253 [Populus alba x Populus x berolinensis]|nr:hypothetical protein NC652_024253 [Populus alba x Populus x berolinensis]
MAHTICSCIQNLFFSYSPFVPLQVITTRSIMRSLFSIRDEYGGSSVHKTRYDSKGQGREGGIQDEGFHSEVSATTTHKAKEDEDRARALRPCC